MDTYHPEMQRWAQQQQQQQQQEHQDWQVLNEQQRDESEVLQAARLAGA